MCKHCKVSVINCKQLKTHEKSNTVFHTHQIFEELHGQHLKIYWPYLSGEFYFFIDKKSPDIKLCLTKINEVSVPPHFYNIIKFILFIETVCLNSHRDNYNFSAPNDGYTISCI